MGELESRYLQPHKAAYIARLKRSPDAESLGRIVEKADLPVWQSVALSGDYLRWPEPQPEPDTWRENTRGLLDQFQRLHDATPHHIETFARRWGPLLLCEHGYPFVCPHGPQGLRCNAAHSEPINVWQRYARSCRALLAIASQPRFDDERVSDADWRTAHPLNLPPPGVGRLTNGEMVARIGEFWLELGDVRPTLSWHVASSTMRLSIGKVGLFSWIAYELSLTLAHADGLLPCDHCATPFIPETLKQKYCNGCKNVPNMLSSRRWAEKKKKEKKKAANAELSDTQPLPAPNC